MGKIAIDIRFPQADIDKMARNIDRAQKELGKSIKESVKWAAVNVATSLAASTKVSQKKRKVVDLRKFDTSYKGPSKLGAIAKNREWKDVFLPIENFGRGVVFFRSKTTGEQLGMIKATKEVHKAEWFVINSKKAVSRAAEIVQIKMSGLAKKTNLWLSKNARSASRNGQASVNWTMGNNTCILSNFLPYVYKAFKTEGKQTVSTALARASDSMANKIEKAIEAKVKAI